MMERPILFSGPMVRAILNGDKTQTRRVVKMPRGSQYSVPLEVHAEWRGHPDNAHKHFVAWADCESMKQEIACPYGEPGDRLWIRETFMPGSESWEPHGNWKHGAGVEIIYAVGPRSRIVPVNREQYGWWQIQRRKHRYLPSIHMPRWASRITLAITQVRVERLKAIDKRDEHGQHIIGDAWAEGFRVPNPTAAFMATWDRLNGKRGYGWEANPWVWVIEFAALDAAGGGVR